MLNTISTILQREVEVFLATNGAGRDGVGAWQTVEACLFALRSISRRVPMDEATIIPLVMRFIPSLPRDKTLMWCVGWRVSWLWVYKPRGHSHARVVANPLPGSRPSSWSGATLGGCEHMRNLCVPLLPPCLWPPPQPLTHRSTLLHQRTKVLAQLIPYLHVEALQAETATAINEVCQACAVELGEPVLAIQSYVAKLKKKAALAVMEGLCCVASELPCVHPPCWRVATHACAQALTPPPASVQIRPLCGGPAATCAADGEHAPAVRREPQGRS